MYKNAMPNCMLDFYLSINPSKLFCIFNYMFVLTFYEYMIYI